MEGKKNGSRHAPPCSAAAVLIPGHFFGPCTYTRKRKPLPGTTWYIAYQSIHGHTLLVNGKVHIQVKSQQNHKFKAQIRKDSSRPRLSRTWIRFLLEPPNVRTRVSLLLLLLLLRFSLACTSAIIIRSAAKQQKRERDRRRRRRRVLLDPANCVCIARGCGDTESRGGEWKATERKAKNRL